MSAGRHAYLWLRALLCRIPLVTAERTHDPALRPRDLFAGQPPYPFSDGIVCGPPVSIDDVPVRARGPVVQVLCWTVAFQRLVRDGHELARVMHEALSAEGAMLDDTAVLDLNTGDVTDADTITAARPLPTRRSHARRGRRLAIALAAAVAVCALCIGVAMLPDDAPAIAPIDAPAGLADDGPTALPALPLSEPTPVCPPPARPVEMDSRPAAASPPAAQQRRRSKVKARRIRLKKTGEPDSVLSISEDPDELSRATYELDLDAIKDTTVEVRHDQLRISVDVLLEDE